MSKIALTPNASGTGTLTIAAPNTSTDRTLTLPDETGTVMSSVSSVATSQLPAGSVLQVVQSVYQTAVTIANTNTSNYYATNMTVSITPSSSSSKIYVVCQGTYGGNTGGTGITIKMLRNIGGAGYTDTSPNVIALQGYLNNITYISYQQLPFTIHCLDSPNTTSAVVYNPYINPSQGTPTGNSYVGGRNNDGLQYSTVTMTAMEIAA